MKNIAIIGAQLGDEGKGKITQDMSVAFDWVIRYSGGDNVGAKVYRNGKEYTHHLLPVIDYANSKAKAFLGSEMVINMEALVKEIKIMQQDFPDVGKSVYVDMDAFIVKPEYIEEDKMTGQQQGTTFRGIKQAYRAKVAREGTRVYDLINNNAPVIKALKELGVQFTTALQMKDTFKKSRLLFEGSQSVMLSLTHGLYPFITSSDTTVSGIYASGFNWVRLHTAYGIAKPYITRSGGQKLITEMPDEEADMYVKRGGEFGATTGRKRGIGYLDLPALKYACARGGINSLIMTKMDMMNGMDKIKVCYSYGKEVFSPNDFKDIVPQYKEVQGWKDARDYKQTKSFLNLVEEVVGVPVEYISAGTNKEDLIPVIKNIDILLEEFPPSLTTGFIKYGDII